MSSPGPSRRSKLGRWFKEVKDDVKEGFKKLVHSTPASRVATPAAASHPLQANPEVGGPTTSATVAEPTNEDALQVPIASPSPIRPQSTPPILLGATPQFERVPSAAPAISSSKEQEIHPLGETSCTIVPDIVEQHSTAIHPAAAPVGQEASQSSQSQAPVVVPETTPTDAAFVDNPQGPQSLTSPTPQPSSSSQPVDNPSDEQTTAQEGKEKASSRWYAGIKNTLALVERATDVFPPLKSAVAAVNGILDIYDAFEDNQQEFTKLAQRVELVHRILSSSPEDAPQEFKDRRDGLERTLKGLATTLEAKRKRSTLTRVAQSKDDQQEIVRLVREINFAIELSMLDVTISGHTLTLQAVKGIHWLQSHGDVGFKKIQENLSRVERGVNRLNKAETLKRLGAVKGFAFGVGNERGRCVAGSRVALLSQLLAWGEDEASIHAFWLNGPAGTGKTAISETFCSELSKRGLLGASFFCSVKAEDLSEVRHIIPTLAKTLAEIHPRFGNALIAALDSEMRDPVWQMDVAEQYEFLILRPAREAFQDDHGCIILCVDALDECRNKHALKEFLLAVISTPPPPFLKVFFTSRPESSLKDQLDTPSHVALRQSLRLHEIEDSLVRADVGLYVHHELGRIQPLRDTYPGDQWPPPEIQVILERSGTLFIVAATIIRYIDDEAGDTVERFREFHGVNASVPSGVHSLYQRILQTAFGALKPKEKENARSCLFLLIVALRPLSVNEYTGFLGLPIHTVRAAFRSLHSVVRVPTNGNDDQPISIYHASFVDFLTEHRSTPSTSEPSARPPWSVDRLQAHSMVTKHCFRIMDTNLRFNIANIQSSFILDSENPHLLAEVKQNISPHLCYSCLGWSHHLFQAHSSPSLFAAMSDFLQLRVLFWIEAMNLLGTVAQCDPDLQRASKWAAKCEDGAALADQLIAVGSFALYFCASPASQSTPHLYISSLATYPTHLGLILIWREHFPGIPHLQHQGLLHGASLVTINVGSDVNGVAGSSDGKYIASGSLDGLVRIWDAQDGKEVKVLKGHSGEVYSVAFSGDGQHLASGSDDHSIRLWNVMAGKEEKVLQGHTNWVNSVAFPSRGGWLVSGSDDGSVRVWDTTSGKEQVVLYGHSKAVCSVAFSPDGAKVASGSQDNTVRLWDWGLGRQLLVLEGHMSMVRSVTFSNDGRRIASGSHDKSVRVWNAETGEEENVMQGHTGWVGSVAFSRDSMQILSSSGDNTMRIWDVPTGKELQMLQGHTNCVASAVFSSDGRRVISGSWDGSVRVWDRPGRKQEKQRLQGHSRKVNSVAFSEDGTQIVSGSDDGSVQIWDGRTGEQLKKLEGHTQEVNSVAFSPDGACIVSGSRDASVRVWDTATGEEWLVLKGHTAPVYSVAFSSSGTHIVSASGDRTVRIWSAVTGLGEMVLEGHTSTVLSATFSGDGHQVASGSGDNTVQIWDVAEGKQLKVSKGHTRHVRSVAFSPDGTRVASGSLDETVRIWDAETGVVRRVLLGHTRSICSVAFSRDGTQVASGSLDNTVRVWDSKAGVEHLVLWGHTDLVQSVAFSRDGTRIVSGSWDTTIRVWNMEGLPYTSEVIKDQATGWLLASDNGQNRLMYAPLTLIPRSPCSLIISGNPIISSFSSSTLSFDTIGDNWHKCFAPPSPS